ncbi:hypothetical protein LOZ61_001075 [Ophidiomyces ophidiicola]|nr:hypothetical protein LOZ61_001075 [Ophidiomyces ophidiicola]KAI1928852.1 hypothetical protein LOZ60_002145 [Ophidiomyces ophidiicola]KAI1960107.1 hypothetical protein LOZ59_002762 [Ophidiomyces ophidiicola]KAI2027919.1 hypothetical protein LOZ45_002518 [Ophidiomyces ophidiicola]KAI2147122.1 hypothetical protein LOZ27_002728 [Ophidiomyces ophidiicola]
MEWHPEEEPLRQLARFLNDSLNAYDHVAQKHAEQMLVQATSSPDFVNYLSYLLFTTQPPATIGFDGDQYIVVRVSAAMNIKSKLRVAYGTISESSLGYLRSSLMIALQDPSVQVRRASGTVIAEMIKQGGVLSWPTLFEELLSMVANSAGSFPITTQESAMSALQKVCEDNRKILDKDYQGQRPLNIILPKLMDFTSNPSSKVRSMALSTIQMFLSSRSDALMCVLDTFLHELFKLANDHDTDVRKTVCQAIVQLVDVAPDKLVPHMEGLVNYIIMQQNNPEDPELALDAAEFWLTVGEQRQLQPSLVPYLGKVVPVLLQSMIYDEDDAILLAGEADDAEVEDKEEDLRPQFAKNKGSRLPSTKTPEQSNGDGQTPEEDGELSDGEIDDDSEFGEDDPESEWTVRKCSAAALDVFATVYHQPVFELILPYLRDNLKHAKWTNREAAVLALGAIADGCMDSVTPHLTELVPYLISLLSDSEPIVRKITCWCLGRYSEWAANLEPNEKTQYFEPMMEGILHWMLDNNKKVQEAASSAFTSLEEKSGANLVPYCEPILRQFVLCFQKYKDRNIYVLYDCVQTLAESVGSELAKPHLVEILMPALIGRWNRVSDQSRELFPLLECLGYVASAYEDAFSPFAAPMFSRSIKIVYENIQGYLHAVNNKALDAPDKDFVTTSLDLLSSIIQAIDPQKSCELVANSQPPFFELLCYCLQDPYSEVRLSAYALLGDCAMKLFPQLQPFLSTIVPNLIKQLDLDSMRDDEAMSGLSVINNACWASGELALSAKADMAPYLEGLYQAFVIIMSNEEVPDSVNENAAIALGRLGTGCAEQLAPHLAQFAELYLRSMSKVEVTREKSTSIMGFNQIVQQNPKAMEACLPTYFHAIALFPAKALAQPEFMGLQQSFNQVLQGYKSLIPNFNAFLSSLPVHVTRKLQSIYQL